MPPRGPAGANSRWRRWVLGLLLPPLLLLGGVLLYLGVAQALSWWPPRTSTTPPERPDLVVYVQSNGVHTDLVLPLRTPATDWTQVFPPVHFPQMPADATHVAIGWGDRDFYLHTPRWRDLTLSRAVKALSGTGRSLLHVTWLREADLGQLTWQVPVSAEQHQRLVEHVLATLPTRPPEPVAGAHYGPQDAFFEARGAYDLFTTCNTWTGDALRHAGVAISPWTPFAGNVVRHLVPRSRTSPSGG